MRRICCSSTPLARSFPSPASRISSSSGPLLQKKKASREAARNRRLSTPPTWSGSFKKGALAAGLMFVFLLVTTHTKHGNAVVTAVIFALLALAIYVPAGFYLETWLWRRRMAKENPATVAQVWRRVMVTPSARKTCGAAAGAGAGPGAGAGAGGGVCA